MATIIFGIINRDITSGFQRCVQKEGVGTPLYSVLSLINTHTIGANQLLVNYLASELEMVLSLCHCLCLFQPTEIH